MPASETNDKRQTRCAHKALGCLGRNGETNNSRFDNKYSDRKTLHMSTSSQANSYEYCNYYRYSLLLSEGIFFSYFQLRFLRFQIFFQGILKVLLPADRRTLTFTHQRLLGKIS